MNALERDLEARTDLPDLPIAARRDRTLPAALIAAGIVVAFLLGAVVQGNLDQQSILIANENTRTARESVDALSIPTPIPLGPLQVCRDDAYGKACRALGGVSAYAGALAAQGAKKDPLGCYDDQGIGICPDSLGPTVERTIPRASNKRP